VFECSSLSSSSFWVTSNGGYLVRSAASTMIGRL